MTVQELIARLEEFDPKLEIIVDEPGRCGPIQREDVRETDGVVTIYAY